MALVSLLSLPTQCTAPTSLGAGQASDQYRYVLSSLQIHLRTAICSCMLAVCVDFEKIAVVSAHTLTPVQLPFLQVWMSPTPWCSLRPARTACWSSRARTPKWASSSATGSQGSLRLKVRQHWCTWHVGVHPSTLCFRAVSGHALQGVPLKPARSCAMGARPLALGARSHAVAARSLGVGARLYMLTQAQLPNTGFLPSQAIPTSVPQSKPSAVRPAAQAARYFTCAASYQS